VFIHHDRELLDFCLRKVRDGEAAADIFHESYAWLLAMKHAAPVIWAVSVPGRLSAPGREAGIYLLQWGSPNGPG